MIDRSIDCRRLACALDAILNKAIADRHIRLVTSLSTDYAEAYIHDLHCYIHSPASLILRAPDLNEFSARANNPWSRCWLGRHGPSSARPRDFSTWGNPTCQSANNMNMQTTLEPFLSLAATLLEVHTRYIFFNLPKYSYCSTHYCDRFFADGC